MNLIRCFPEVNESVQNYSLHLAIDCVHQKHPYSLATLEANLALIRNISEK